jgi:hypothetical protein
MSGDRYRDRLKRAAWTWRENGGNPRRKDRVEGRRDKRAAREADRREVRAYLQTVGNKSWSGSGSGGGAR